MLKRLFCITSPEVWFHGSDGERPIHRTDALTCVPRPRLGSRPCVGGSLVGYSRDSTFLSRVGVEELLLPQCVLTCKFTPKEDGSDASSNATELLNDSNDSFISLAAFSLLHR